MKMKLWDRLILRLGAVFTLLTGLLSIFGATRLMGAEVAEGKFAFLLELLPVVMLAAGIITVFVSLYDLFLPHRYHPRRRAFVAQPTEHGELRIAVSAIENLILRCVETHKEVKVLSMQICNRRGAVNVALRVAVNSNISIPHAVEQLQTQIKRYLAASSGIEVRDISVSVERATGDESALPDEPLVQVAVVAAETPVEEKKEKVSMHQRVFGRDTSKSVAEQVAEAEAIEMPAEESAAQEDVQQSAEAPQDEQPQEAPEAIAQTQDETDAPLPEANEEPDEQTALAQDETDENEAAQALAEELKENETEAQA